MRNSRKRSPESRGPELVKLATAALLFGQALLKLIEGLL